MDLKCMFDFYCSFIYCSLLDYISSDTSDEILYDSPFDDDVFSFISTFCSYAVYFFAENQRSRRSH